MAERLCMSKYEPLMAAKALVRRAISPTVAPPSATAMSNTRPRLGVISATVTVWAQPYSKGQRICRTSILSLIFFVSHIAVLMATTSSRVWDRRERGRNSPKSRPIKNLFRIIWLLIVGRCGCCGGQIGELSFHHSGVSCR